MEIFFKQFRAEGGCNSYILAGVLSKKACIIDPVVDEIDSYEEFLAQYGLSVAVLLDTHTHADHYSGTSSLAQKLNAPIAMGEATQSQRASIKLKDGQKLELGGDLQITTMATPGHTPDSVCFLASGKWGQAVFTGDTLLIGSSGRVDFPGSDAGAQYDSIYKKLGVLADSTWVFSGHDYSDLLFSTIGVEKKSNPHWQFKDRDSFIKMKKAELLESAPILAKIVDFNLTSSPAACFSNGGAHTACAAGITVSESKSCSIQEFRPIMDQGQTAKRLMVDVREPKEFAAGHIAGIKNIPLSELFLHWNEFQSADSIYLSCQKGGRSQMAAQSLQRLGIKNAISVNGGFLAWNGAGFPIAK